MKDFRDFFPGCFKQGEEISLGKLGEHYNNKVLVGLGFKDLKVFNKALLGKLDLELACDHINGKFLDCSMLKMGVGVGIGSWREWRKWVSFCISSVRYSAW